MNDFSDNRVPVIHFVRDLFLCRIICCLPPHDRVPTDLASQGIEEVGESPGILLMVALVGEK